MLKKLSKEVMNILKNSKKVFMKQPLGFRLLLVCALIVIILNHTSVGQSLQMYIPGFSRNLEGFEGDGENKTLVYLFWKDCGHCKKFNPVWDEFSGGNKSQIKTVKYEKDSAEGAASAKKYDVNAFPYLILVDKNGKKIKDFDGERTVESLNQFVQANDV